MGDTVQMRLPVSVHGREIEVQTIVRRSRVAPFLPMIGQIRGAVAERDLRGVMNFDGIASGAVADFMYILLPLLRRSRRRILNGAMCEHLRLATV